MEFILLPNFPTGRWYWVHVALENWRWAVSTELEVCTLFSQQTYVLGVPSDDCSTMLSNSHGTLRELCRLSLI